MADTLNPCVVSERWYAISISVCTKAGRNSYLGPDSYFNQKILRNFGVHLRENAEIKIKKEICMYHNMLVTYWPPVILSCMVSAMVQLVFSHFIRDKNFKIKVKKISTIRYPLIDPVLKWRCIKVYEKIKTNLTFTEDIINKHPKNIPLCVDFTKYSFNVA
jgi:hypothetical protein